jgi:hypothetical protein
LLSLEQSRVLDGNHGLEGEGLQQRDLARGECSYLGTRNCDRADGIAVTQHRHRHDASIGHRLGKIQGQGGIGGIRKHIWDLHYAAVQDCASCSRVIASWSRKHSLKAFESFRCKTMTGSKAKKFVVESHHEGKPPLAYPRRVLRDGIEHWLNIVRRDRDDAQNFRSGCL